MFICLKTSKLLGKVQLFSEGHKNMCNLLHGMAVDQVNVQTMKKIMQIFVAFPEKLNFIQKNITGWTCHCL